MHGVTLSQTDKGGFLASSPSRLSDLPILDVQMEGTAENHIGEVIAKATRGAQPRVAVVSFDNDDSPSAIKYCHLPCT